MSFSRSGSARLAFSSLAIGLASLVACAAPADGDAASASEKVAATRSAVIKGKASDASQDAVVLLVSLDRSTGEVGSCTGTLLSPRLVLTARHCVADTDEGAACDADGTPIAAGVVRANHKAESMYVFTGPKRPDFGPSVKPAGQGAQILDDGGKNLCNHDIALVVLKEPIEGAQIAPIRLDGDVEKGEIITAVGWGITEKTNEPEVRQQRTGIAVTGVGPDATTDMPVPPNEFQVGESICSGDSGGPAIAESGAVIGVVSRGGNNTQPDPQDPSSSCIGKNSENLYTKVSPFKDLIMKGFEIVEAEPWLENGPDPRLLKPGSACTDGSECRSNLCIGDPTQNNATTCQDDCSTNPCPEGTTCTDVGSLKVCRTPAQIAKATSTTTTTGCSTSPGVSSNGMIGFALAALGLVAARRRRA